MKKSNIKLFSLLFAAFTMTATMVSCGNDDNKSNPETNAGGTEGSSSNTESFSKVSGWGVVQFAYSTMYDANEKIEIRKGKKTVNGTTVSFDSLYFTSPMWGTGKFDLTTKTGSLTVPRRNPQTMEPMGEAKTYDATVTGSSKEGQFVFTIPALMQGGTTITTIIGGMPVAVEISKTYDINSYVDNASNYFQPKSYATSGEKMVIVASPESRYVKVNIEYTSKSTPSWGTYVFKNIEVDINSDKYTLYGDGTATIVNHNNNTSKEYTATIEASVMNGKITGKISIPVMGGITIHLNPEDFDTVINNGN